MLLKEYYQSMYGKLNEAVDDEQMIKYKDEDGESKEMSAKAAKRMAKDHPAKIEYDKQKGAGDGDKKKGVNIFDKPSDDAPKDEPSDDAPKDGGDPEEKTDINDPKFKEDMVDDLDKAKEIMTKWVEKNNPRSDAWFPEVDDLIKKLKSGDELFPGDEYEYGELASANNSNLGPAMGILIAMDPEKYKPIFDPDDEKAEYWDEQAEKYGMTKGDEPKDDEPKDEDDDDVNQDITDPQGVDAIEAGEAVDYIQANDLDADGIQHMWDSLQAKGYKHYDQGTRGDNYYKIEDIQKKIDLLKKGMGSDGWPMTSDVAEEKDKAKIGKMMQLFIKQHPMGDEKKSREKSENIIPKGSLRRIKEQWISENM